MADLLIYSEKRDTALELLSKGREFAQALGLGLSAAVLGDDAGAVASELAAQGAARVFVSQDPALADLATDSVAEALAQIAGQAPATVILLGSTRRGKELAGRLAQKLSAGCVTDVNAMELEDGKLVAARYDFGGSTVARETVETPVQVYAVMPKTFEPAPPPGEAGQIIDAPLSLSPARVTVVDRRPKEGEAVNLEDAPVIVGVGRGIAKREDVTLGQDLAAAFGGELACTKGLADWGWLSEDRVVGLSGAKAKPDLYVSVGISGQIQHTVGVSSSKVIVAINKDKDAPIFQLADYGIVGDLYEVVPALVERLKSL